MSKVVSRPYCSSCKKLSHGKENCKGGKCGCKCRTMTPEQLEDLQKKQRDETDHIYSQESQEEFQKIMNEYRKQKGLAALPVVQSVVDTLDSGASS